MVIPLRQKQARDLALMIKHTRIGNTSDPGTGKTAPTNVWIEYLWFAAGVKTIFIMPTTLYDQNKASFQKFTSLEPEKICIIEDVPINKREEYFANPEIVVYIASNNFFKPYQAKRKDKVISRPSHWEEIKRLQPWVKDWACVVDEFHLCFKSMSAGRTKWWLYCMQREFKYVAGLTGTPIDGRLDSIYPLIAAIEPRYYAGYGDFLNQHAVRDFFGRITGWRNTQKIKQIFDRHFIRHTFEEIHGPEAKVIENVKIKMHPEHRKAYNELAKLAIARLVTDAAKLGQVTDQAELAEMFNLLSDSQENPAVAVMRTRQLLQCPEDIGFKLPLAKDDRVLTYVEAAAQAGKSVLIFTPFVSEVERLKTLLETNGISTGAFHGRVSKKKRRQLAHDFTSKKLTVQVATPKLCSIGLDWDHVDMVIFTAGDYMDSNFVQGYRRAIRGKRTTPVLIYRLEYEDSIDQHINFIMEAKSDLAAEIDDREKINFTGEKTKTRLVNRQKSIGFSSFLKG